MSASRHADSHPPDPELRDVAGYRLLRRIGEGGMSTVFLGYDVASDRPVAVKLLADHLAHSREFVNRFYREARLSRLLSHPNLVQGVAAGFDPVAGKHYLVLEYIDGPTAHSVLATSGRMAVGVAVRIGIDIARALQFLHSRQYVHRDVKPDNVLLHPDGVAKLADLGLAKRLNDDPQLTTATQGVGTSYYMAYEQSLNANLVDGRSDVFALGATLYHLLTGEVPFPGSTHEEVSRGKESDEFRPVNRSNPHVPASLAAIVARTLACDPRERYQTAAELASALEATGLATPIPEYPAGPGGGSPDAPTRADLAVLDPVTPPPAPPGESFTRTVAAAALPLAPAALGGGWAWWPVVGLLALVAAGAVAVGVSAWRRPPAPTLRVLPHPPSAGHVSPPIPGGHPPAPPQ